MAIAEELAALRERTLAEIAAADTSAALEAVRVAELGKSGHADRVLEIHGPGAR